jgi:serine O-acetyltransferase
MIARPLATMIEQFRLDAARWVTPQGIADPAEVTPRVMAKLAYHHPPLRAMAWFRLAAAVSQMGVRGFGPYVQRRLLRVYGFELAYDTPVGGGLYVAHPVGCVLHAKSIGPNVTVVGQVTFGALKSYEWPTIGEGAYLGIGSRVLGNITVGAHSQIGANAVVLSDVPDGATAVGMPARVIDGSKATSA